MATDPTKNPLEGSPAIVESFIEATQSYKEESVFSDELLEALENQRTPTIPFQLSDAIGVLTNQQIYMGNAAIFLGEIEGSLRALGSLITDVVQHFRNPSRDLSNPLRIEGTQVGDAIVVRAEPDIAEHEWPNFMLSVKGVIPVTPLYADHLAQELEVLKLAQDWREDAESHWNEYGKEQAVTSLFEHDWQDAARHLRGEPNLYAGVPPILSIFQQVDTMMEALAFQIDDALFNLGLRESTVEIVMDPSNALVGAWRYEHGKPTESYLGSGTAGALSKETLTPIVARMKESTGWFVEWGVPLRVKP